MATLADVLNMADEAVAAQGLMERTLEARSRVLGPEHRDTLRSASRLAQLLARQEQLLNVTISAMYTLSALADMQRRQEQAVPSMSADMQRCFSQIQERIEELKRPPQWREAVTRRAA